MITVTMSRGIRASSRSFELSAVALGLTAMALVILLFGPAQRRFPPPRNSPLRRIFHFPPLFRGLCLRLAAYLPPLATCTFVQF